MKKTKFKHLTLNKKSISNLNGGAAAQDSNLCDYSLTCQTYCGTCYTVCGSCATLCDCTTDNLYTPLVNFP